jgi:hypothetical protein
VCLVTLHTFRVTEPGSENLRQGNLPSCTHEGNIAPFLTLCHVIKTYVFSHALTNLNTSWKLIFSFTSTKQPTLLSE